MNEKDDVKLSAFHLEDEYEEKIYTVSATEEFNSDIALDLKDKLINKRINLLLSRNDVRENFSEEVWFNKLSPEDQVDILNPYVQTALLENEMVLLERIDHPKFVKLKEQSGKRKDRYTSLSYGNYFITLLERDLVKHDNSIDDYLFFMQSGF